MNTTEISNKTIGEIVSDDYRTAQVFKKHGIDFCCGGGRTLADACEHRGIDRETVIRELNMLGSSNSLADNYKDWSPDFLVDYIINNHHQYVRSKLPEIQIYAEKVAKVHGGRHPETIEILRIVKELTADMKNHMKKEEEILFPYVKKLAAAEQHGENPDEPEFGTAAEPIAMMEDEHEEAGGGMDEIRRLSNDFTPPEDACATYRVLYENLREFQDDLHKHVHLENNILFPKTLEMEKRLN